MIETKPISSLSEMLDYLPQCNAQEYKSITEQMFIPISDLEPYMTWKKDGYTRNCIVQTENYELILLCWEPHTKTSIHCHDGQKCWVHGISGKLDENFYDLKDGKPILLEQNEIFPRQTIFMENGNMHHQLLNNLSERTISLHLYINPIKKCTNWSEQDGRFNHVVLGYDNVGPKT